MPKSKPINDPESASRRLAALERQDRINGVDEEDLSEITDGAGELREIFRDGDEPAYLADVKRRAAEQQGGNVTDVYRHDQELTGAFPSTPGCLRADEAMQYVLDRGDTAHRVVEHVDQCGSCRRLVDSLRPSAAREEAILNEFFDPDEDDDEIAEPAIMRRVRTSFEKLDSAMSVTMRVAKYGTPVLLCLIAVFAISPYSATDEQLMEQAVVHLNSGELESAEQLLDRMETPKGFRYVGFERVPGQFDLLMVPQDVADKPFVSKGGSIGYVRLEDHMAKRESETDVILSMDEFPKRSMVLAEAKLATSKDAKIKIEALEQQIAMMKTAIERISDEKEAIAMQAHEEEDTAAASDAGADPGEPQEAEAAFEENP